MLHLKILHVAVSPKIGVDVMVDGLSTVVEDVEGVTLHFPVTATAVEIVSTVRQAGLIAAKARGFDLTPEEIIVWGGPS